MGSYLSSKKSSASINNDEMVERKKIVLSKNNYNTDHVLIFLEIERALLALK